MADPLILGAAVGLVLLGVAVVLWRRRAARIVFDLTVDHPIFYPHRQSTKRLLIMRLHLSHSATVNVDVYDEFNRVVARLVRGRKHGAGAHFHLWDGRDGTGKLLSGGSYLVQGTALTALDNATSGVWVRLDSSQARQPIPFDPSQRFEEWVDEGQIINAEVGM
jgi:hypothetical protein